MVHKCWSATLLTCIGAAGVVITSIATAKATPKALSILKELEAKKGEKLTKMEIVKAAAPVYIPAVISGALTIACIFSANVFNQRHQAMLVSAYTLLDSSFKEYRNKVEEIYGEDADIHVAEEMVKDNTTRIRELRKEGELLFFDYRTMHYFNSTVDKVLDKITTDDGLECYIITTPFDNDLPINYLM